MARILVAFFTGCVFVGIVTAYNRYGTGDIAFLPFLLLLPGILLASVVSGGALDFKDNSHPQGLGSVILLYGFDIVLYGGIAYLILSLLHWPERRAK
jgi:hypothetical protein